MEGATGVTCPDDCTPGSPRWDRFRSLFTADVAAVCAGFFAAGVTEVTVNEAHSTMRNLILEALDPRVCLLTGHHKPFGMMEGITARPAAMAACVPTVERTGHRGVAFSAAAIADLYPCFRVVARVGASAAEPRYA